MKYSIETLNNQIAEKGNVEYVFFWGHQPSKDGRITKSCMSQWWLSKFKEDGHLYHTAEHYMMAHKAKLFGDKEIMNEIISNSNPKEVKALGRKVSNFEQDKWEAHKYAIVLQGNILKFSQNRDLADFLLSTEDKVIVEASPVDRIWGIGMAENHPDAYNPSKWKGPNLLGFALMETRDFLNNSN